MQKYLKLLEAKVEWIVLGLGGIYMLWMLYAYVITPPVTVALVKDHPLTPAEVDEAILNDQGKKLEADMVRSDTIEIKVTDVLAPYLAKIDEKNLNTPALATWWSGTRGTTPEAADIQTGPGNVQIAALPKPPAPMFVAQTNGITTAMLPASNAPAGSAPAAAVNPNPAGAAQLLPPHKDVVYSSFKFKIPAAALVKAWGDAFNNPNVPGYSNLLVTRFLKTDLIRQEKMPNGQWGDETIVKPIRADELLAFPGDKVASDDKPARQAGYEYLKWATDFQREVVSPDFFDVIPTAPEWVAPGTPAVDPATNPNAPPVADQPRTRRPDGPIIPGRTMRPGTGRFNGGARSNRPAGPAAADINIDKLAEDKEIIVHDTTVLDGHTYRYQLRYYLSNPVWDSTNLASKDLSNQFALPSAASDWTEGITMPSRTHLFVTNISGAGAAGGGKVAFDLFEYKDGHYVKSKVEAVPGDTVREWTIVDIRQEIAKRTDYYALVMDMQGRMDHRDRKKDAADGEYDKLKALADVGGATPRPQALAR